LIKNIWILNHYSKLGSGRHYKFAYYLSRKGYNVKLFAASTIHNSNDNRINDSSKYIEKIENEVSCIYIKSRNYIGNGIKRILNMIDYAYGLLFVSKKFDSEKPNIIYASSVHPLTWISGYILSRRYNAKFIVETRDLWPETLVAMGQITRGSIPARILYRLEKFIYKKADKLIFTFPGGKDYVDGIGLDSSKVRYINNGIDIEEFNYNIIKNIYSDDDLENDTFFKVLYTGSMGQANELSYLIKAAEIIKNKNINDIKFILFGDGYQKKELEHYVQQNNIDNVIFKGKVEKKYVPNVLSKGNLNVFTGKHIYLYKYGLSLNKMFEYFGSGKPTVSNIECGYDLLDKYDSGLTVKGGDPQALTEGILKFYNMSKYEYNNYCNNALIASKDFDFKVLTDKLEEIIKELYIENKEEKHENTIN